VDGGPAPTGCGMSVRVFRTALKREEVNETWSWRAISTS
jgi:hypothetical protein